MDHVSTDFGADSSSRFPFKVRTNRQTRLKRSTHAGGYSACVGNKCYTRFCVSLRGSVVDILTSHACTKLTVTFPAADVWWLGLVEMLPITSTMLFCVKPG